MLVYLASVVLQDLYLSSASAASYSNFVVLQRAHASLFFPGNSSNFLTDLKLVYIWDVFSLSDQEIYPS